jgi:hypothetical protein
MEHDGISIAQSGAISRYIAKIGNLNGSNDADFAKSEMLLGEFDDLLTGIPLYFTTITSKILLLLLHYHRYD